MRPSLTACFFFASLFVVAFLAADEPAKPKDREFTADELELIGICDEWQTTYRQWLQESQEIKDGQKRILFIQEKVNSAPFVPRLVAFEKKHRGTHVGLMAVRRLASAGREMQGPTNPEYQGFSHVLGVLGDYANHAELTEAIRPLEFATLREVETGLQTFIAQENGVSTNNRDFAKWVLASWILHQRDGGDQLQKWLADVDAGKIEVSKAERDGSAAMLAGLVPRDRLVDLVPQAYDILEKLAASDTDAHHIAVKAVNGSRHIVQVDDEASQRKIPRVKDLATGRLFKEKYLLVGRPAPDLTVKLLSGEDFSFAQQRGKVLVVQFSFTGCRPCEATYPTLKELTAKYPDRLAVITFMRDAEPDDAKAAVSSGKMTWKVSWDGVSGVQATRWRVASYPTIHVFGPDGLLVERELAGAKLQETVEALLK